MGYLLLSTSYNTYQEASKAQSWPTVHGRIISSKLLITPAVGVRDVNYFYRPDVQYEYTVDQRKFQGRDLTVRNRSMGRKESENIVAKYSKEQTVTVYYLAEDPTVSVLDPNNTSDSIPLLVMGLCFLIIPPILVLLIAGRDLLPMNFRFWWRIKFGDLRENKFTNEDDR